MQRSSARPSAQLPPRRRPNSPIREKARIGEFLNVTISANTEESFCVWRGLTEDLLKRFEAPHSNHGLAVSP